MLTYTTVTDDYFIIWLCIGGALFWGVLGGLLFGKIIYWFIERLR